MALATGGLVWATAALVRATKKLTLVGEHTWQSNQPLMLWIYVSQGKLVDTKEANLKVRNAVSVPIKIVVAHIYHAVFDRDSHGKLHITRQANHPRQVVIGGLKGSEVSANFSIWEDARGALEYLESERNNVSEAAVAGLRFTIAATHDITGRSYRFSANYEVSDLQRLSIGIKKIGEQEWETF